MSQSLKEVIDLLYKPPQGQRQAIAVSRRVAEQLPQLPTVAMISITAPERPPAEVDGFSQLLRLSFADVDHLGTEISARAKAKIKDSLTIQQAKEIHAFVRTLPAEIRTLIVHCEWWLLAIMRRCARTAQDIWLCGEREKSHESQSIHCEDLGCE